jgi:signal transduction histidine kinase
MVGAPVSEKQPGSQTTLRVGWAGGSAMALILLAVVARTAALAVIRPRLPVYLGLEILFVALFIAVLWKPGVPRWALNLYFLLQVALVLALLSLRPQFDSVLLLFLPLSHQAALIFEGRLRWAWILGLVGLTAGSLILFLGALRGLALALPLMAFEVVIPAYLIAGWEIESARLESARLLREVQITHERLQMHMGQVEQLAAMQERNRLARELHDTVSQLIFSISLTARAAELLLDQDVARARPLLSRLQALTAEALGQLRSVIVHLHPPQ